MPAALQHARAMRRQPTNAERKLWTMLRRRQMNGFYFWRQIPIGRYIVDFVCFEAKLVIEADGRQHTDNAHDDERTAYLEQQGHKVLRFDNYGIITDTEAVLRVVLYELSTRSGLHPLPSPPPQGGRESQHGRGSCLSARTSNPF